MIFIAFFFIYIAFGSFLAQWGHVLYTTYLVYILQFW